MKKICETASRPKYPQISTGSLQVILLVILLGLGSRIEVFGEAPLNLKSELKMIRFVLKVLKSHNCEKKGEKSCLARASGGLLHIVKAGDHTIAETYFKISIKNKKKL